MADQPLVGQGFDQYVGTRQGTGTQTEFYNKQSGQGFSNPNDLASFVQPYAQNANASNVFDVLKAGYTPTKVDLPQQVPAQSLANPTSPTDVNGLLQQHQQIANQYAQSFLPSDQEKQAMSDAVQSKNTLRNFDTSVEGGIQNIMKKPVALEFQQGQEAALTRDAGFTRSSLANSLSAYSDNLAALQQQRQMQQQALQAQMQNGQFDVNTAIALQKNQQDQNELQYQHQTAAKEFALQHYVQAPFYTVDGKTIYNTNTGKPYTNQEDFFKDSGVKSWAQVPHGTIQTVNPQSGAEREAVLGLINKYGDAGIVPTDSLSTASAKLKNSSIYAKDVAGKYLQVYDGQGGMKLFNTANGQYVDPSNITGNTGGFPTTSPAEGFRTDRNNNPTAMTTDVAKQSGLIEGVDYVQGDPFTSNGKTYYTAKLIGDPIATTIKSIDKGGLYTQSGAPRWTYLNSIPEAKNWNNLSQEQKVNVVTQMYQHEGGSGSLVGAVSGNNNNTKPYNSNNQVDALAMTWLQTGVVPKGNGKTSPTAGIVEARGRGIAQQLGLGDNFNPALITGENKANIKSLVQTTSDRDQLQTNLAAADANFQKLTGFMQQYGLNNSSIPLANQLQQNLAAKGIKGKDAVAAQAAMQSALAGLKTEYSQILARGGQRNEAIDREASKLIPGNLSPQELQTVVNYIKSEGQNVLTAKNNTITQIQGRFSGGSNSPNSTNSSTGTTADQILQAHGINVSQPSQPTSASQPSLASRILGFFGIK